MRSLLVAGTKTELLGAIVNTMLNAGWNNDGAPTATILVGAADSEGRTPYIKLFENTSPESISFQIGNGRSGDDLTQPGTIALASGSGRLLYDTNPVQIFATDRWVFVESLKSPNGFIAGMMECPYSPAIMEAPLFFASYYNAAGAAVTVRLMRLSDTRIYILKPPSGPTAYVNSGSALLVFWINIVEGTRDIPYTNLHFFRDRGESGPVYPTHKWWIMDHQGTGLYGYLKGAFLSYGIGTGNDRSHSSKFIIGDRYYYRVGIQTGDQGMLNFVNEDRSVCVLLPGELV